MASLAQQSAKPSTPYRASHAKAASAAARRDRGIVLKNSTTLGESDRIVTLLSEGNGLVRAVAKGVRKTSSRFGARLEPFMYCDFLWLESGRQAREGSSLATISQAELVRPYGIRIVKKYDAYVSAGIIAEVAGVLSENDVLNAGEYYRLTHGAFAALARQAHPSELIADSYLMRALALAGWSINLQSCSRCSSPQARWFSAALGGLACRDCSRSGKSVAIAGRTLRLLAALADGDWAAADSAEAGARSEASALVAQYTLWHLGARIKSLDNRSVDKGLSTRMLRV